MLDFELSLQHLILVPEVLEAVLERRGSALRLLFLLFDHIRQLCPVLEGPQTLLNSLDILLNGLDVLVEIDHKFLIGSQGASLSLDVLLDLANRNLVLNTHVLVDRNLMLMALELVADGADTAGGFGDVLARTAGFHRVECLDSGIPRTCVLDSPIDDLLRGLTLQERGDILMAVVGGAAKVQEQSRVGKVDRLDSELLRGNIVDIHLHLHPVSDWCHW